LELEDSEEEKFQELLKKVPGEVFVKFETNLEDKFKVP